MSAFTELVGKNIIAMFINQDSTTLIFQDVYGVKHVYATVAECCNDVWITHISGTKCFNQSSALDILAGTSVLDIRESTWKVIEADVDNSEHIEDCFWSITTDRGYVDLEVRNTHNGFYGGKIEYVGSFSNSINTLHEVLSCHNIDVENITKIQMDF